jgi:hypothetical protein
MKNFLNACFLFAMVISLFLGSCKKSDDDWSKTKLRFISEEYKPFNYTENSNAYGLAPLDVTDHVIVSDKYLQAIVMRQTPLTNAISALYSL